jgi:hypothetical protein
MMTRTRIGTAIKMIESLYEHDCVGSGNFTERMVKEFRQDIVGYCLVWNEEIVEEDEGG